MYIVIAFENGNRSFVVLDKLSMNYLIRGFEYIQQFVIYLETE